ncbi:MAG: carbon-nitrogen hydrolase family protein [Xanthobacteraceae bacterium]|nr:carbon-nitrogen hydrolase family protein [Xanthobacteraceae bacterium]
MSALPKYKVAAVQAAPCFLDVRETMLKVHRLATEAANNGAKLVVFPEVFIAGYPYWNWIYNPFRGSPWFRKLVLNSIKVPGPEVEDLCKMAKSLDIHLVIGVNERDERSLGALYNTNLLISPEHGLINKRRKLVPTFAEKLTWASGNGDGIRATDTPLGRIGMLACGENTNTLARFALLAEGELVHIANYISFPFVQNYDMPEAIRIRSAAHSFEGKVFNIVSCSSMSNEIIDMLATNEEERKMMSGTPNAFSGIINPQGQLISEPLIDVEGIAYANIDLEQCIEPKQFQDIIGNYNRFDIFQLHVDRRPRTPLNLQGDSDEAYRDTLGNGRSPAAEILAD